MHLFLPLRFLFHSSFLFDSFFGHEEKRLLQHVNLSKKMRVNVEITRWLYPTLQGGTPTVDQHRDEWLG